MGLDISTPAILFPAISLLMLAYTNRFLALSQLIRSLHQNYQAQKLSKTLQQIKHLRYRVFMIRLMQAFGASAILGCTLSIFSLLFNYKLTGFILFIISMGLFLGSLITSLVEILMSSHALHILLSDIEDDPMNGNGQHHH